jgi:protein-tyrosine-phosphatase
MVIVVFLVGTAIEVIDCRSLIQLPKKEITMKTLTSVIFVTGLMFSSAAAVAAQPTQELTEQVAQVLAVQASEVSTVIQQQIAASLQASFNEVVTLANVEATQINQVVAVKSKSQPKEVEQPESMME